MEKRYRSSQKENVNTNRPQKGENPCGKSLYKRKMKDNVFAVQTNAETRSDDGKGSHEVIVDEVHKPCQVHHRKESNHIGEEAFLPISLETLRRTLSKRIHGSTGVRAIL